MRAQTRRRRPNNRRRLIQGGLLGGASLLLFVVVAAVWTLVVDSGPTTEADSDVEQIPVADTPQVAAGVRAAEPAIDRGNLPLDTSISQVFELVNTGTGTARLGQPTIEVLDGCCPPQPAISHASLAPGETAVVALTMQMHEGMDGPHLFHLTVPVQAGGDDGALHLYFKGDFGG